jgi:hypothetical protein
MDTGGGRALGLDGTGWVVLPYNNLAVNNYFTVSLHFRTTSSGGLLRQQKTAAENSLPTAVGPRAGAPHASTRAKKNGKTRSISGRAGRLLFRCSDSIRMRQYAGTTCSVHPVAAQVTTYARMTMCHGAVGACAERIRRWSSP